MLNGQKDYTTGLMWIRAKKAFGEINKCISPFSLNFNPQTHRNTHTCWCWCWCWCWWWGGKAGVETWDSDAEQRILDTNFTKSLKTKQKHIEKKIIKHNVEIELAHNFWVGLNWVSLTMLSPEVCSTLRPPASNYAIIRWRRGYSFLLQICIVPEV